MNNTVNNVIFLDIETSPLVKEFTTLDERLQKLFLKKFDHQRKEIKGTAVERTRFQTDQELWDAHAALTTEFLKIKAICVGTIPFKAEDDQCITIKMMYSEDEAQLLRSFAKTIDTIKGVKGNGTFFPSIVAHNGYGFDFPILARKFIQHRIQLPSELMILGKKTWNWNNLIDTQELWSMGEFNKRTSLDLLAATLGLASPKTMLEGLNPIEFYYKYGLQQLAIYCAGDVVPLVNAYRLMYGMTELTSVRIYDGVVGKLIESVDGKDPVTGESAGGDASGNEVASQIKSTEAPSQEINSQWGAGMQKLEQASEAGATYFADQEKIKSEKAAEKTNEQVKKTYKPRGKKKNDNVQN